MAAESGSQPSGSPQDEFIDDAGQGEYAVTNLKLNKGPDASVIVTLTDERHADLKQSISIAFESGVSMESPISFNLYPDISYYLPGLRSSESLVLNFQPNGCDMKRDSKHLVMSYRMCYKVMKTIADPQPLIKGPRLEIDTQKSHVLVPVANGDNVVLQRRKE
ncbi:hypothetical protein L6164_003639 [Bauhinia variegata]|nr:hypothetical protein L6164_003639 [Bauhinia variegata]